MRDSLQLPAKGKIGSKSMRVVVARSALRIKHLDLSTLPPPERLNAARLQALAWSPFESTAMRFVIQSGKTLVMAWDARVADQHARQAGLAGMSIAYLPEPMLCAPSRSDGVRMVQGLQGFEGQAWLGGWLSASRWWPEQPTTEQWANFLHAAGNAELVVEETILPLPELPKWLAKPWSTLREPGEDATQSARLEKMLVFGFGLLLVAATAGQARQAWERQQTETSLRSERDSLLVAAEPILAERARAQAVGDAANRLAARLSGGDPLGVMASLAAVLPREGVLLKELIVQGRDVRVAFDVSNTVTRASLVTALQSRGAFINVTETTEGIQRGWVAFTFQAAKDGVGVPAKAAASATQ